MKYKIFRIFFDRYEYWRDQGFISEQDFAENLSKIYRDLYTNLEFIHEPYSNSSISCII